MNNSVGQVIDLFPMSSLSRELMNRSSTPEILFPIAGVQLNSNINENDIVFNYHGSVVSNVNGLPKDEFYQPVGVALKSFDSNRDQILGNIQIKKIPVQIDGILKIKNSKNIPIFPGQNVVTFPINSKDELINTQKNVSGFFCAQIDTFDGSILDFMFEILQEKKPINKEFEANPLTSSEMSSLMLSYKNINQKFITGFNSYQQIMNYMKKKDNDGFLVFFEIFMNQYLKIKNSIIGTSITYANPGEDFYVLKQ